MLFGSAASYEPRQTFQTPLKEDLSRTQFAQDRGVIYKTDGTGRDTYIYNDNGGFASGAYQGRKFNMQGGYFPAMKAN